MFRPETFDPQTGIRETPGDIWELNSGSLAADTNDRGRSLMDKATLYAVFIALLLSVGFREEQRRNKKSLLRIAFLKSR